MIRHVIAASVLGVGATLLATSGVGCAAEAPRGASSAAAHDAASATPPSIQVVASSSAGPSSTSSPSAAASARASASALVSGAPRSPLEIVACTTNLDCGWDDPCVPKLCEAAHKSAAACEETAPAPGSCGCVEGACTLRPTKVPAPVGPCEPGGCQVDRSGGTCVADTLGVPIGFRPRKGVSGGPVCDCERAGCVFRYIDPIPCKSDRDCWVSEDPRPHPIPRPRALRARDFKPCADGETEPLCNAQGHCALGLRFSC